MAHITKPAVNMLVIIKNVYGSKVMCNKHFNPANHRAVGIFTNKECDDCREIQQRCTFEDIGL